MAEPSLIERLRDRVWKLENNEPEWIVFADEISDDYLEAASTLEDQARLIGECASVVEQLRSFIGVMFGQGPDCIIPETVPTPLGVPVKVGAIMQDTEALLTKFKASVDGATK